MMRFAFVSDPNGHLVTVVSAPKSARSLLTHAYNQTNTVPAADVVDAVSWLPPPTPEPEPQPDPLPVSPAEPPTTPTAPTFLGGL